MGALAALDKLESVPGRRVELSTRRYRAALADPGAVICAATSERVPGALYALRDVTTTVDSIPLINKKLTADTSSPRDAWKSSPSGR